MRPMQLRRLSVLLLALSSGCSFAFSNGPPAEHAQMPYFDCTSTYGLPVADGVLGIGGVLSAVQTFKLSEDEYARRNSGGKRNVAGGLNLGIAGVYAASAIYGIVQAERCERAKTALKARILGPMLTRPTAQSLPPPPPLPAPAAAPAPAPVPAPTETPARAAP
jgi:hypothetical protein